MSSAKPQIMSDIVANADVRPVGLDGGLNVKVNPQRMAPPATTRADNAWFIEPGTVKQLPSFASKPLPVTPAYIYNMGARDPMEPCIGGDVLVHGEIAVGTDSYPGLQNGSASGAQASGFYTAAPLYPFSVRTRTATGALGNHTGVPGSQAQLITLRGESTSGDTANPYQVTIFNDGTTVAFLVGRLGSQAQNSTLTTVSGVTPAFVDAAIVPGTDEFILAVLPAGSTSVSFYRYNMSSLGFTTYTAASLGASGRPRGFCLVRHANRILCVLQRYTTATAGTVVIRDVILGTEQTMATMASTTGTLGGVTAFSSDTHNLNAISVMVVAWQENQTVKAQPVAFGTVGSMSFGTAVTLSQPAVVTNGGGLPGLATLSEPDIYLTGAFGRAGQASSGTYKGSIFHTAWEYTPALGNIPAGYFRTVFSHNITVSVSSPYTLTVAAFSDFAFRDPCGARIRGKAFGVVPPEARAGVDSNLAANGATSVLCPVSTGAWTMVASNTYSQPTYWLIDGKANVATRWAEAKGPNASDAQTTVPSPVSFYGYSSGFTSTTASNQHMYEIVWPYWRLADARFSTTTVGALSVVNPTPNYAVWQPAVAVFAFQGQLANPPMVQAGRNTVLTGGLTMQYDGRQLFEAGFNTNPGPVWNPGAGGAYTYYYRAIYKWIDNNGLVHRSQPSVPVPVSSALTTGNTAIIIPNLGQSFRSPVYGTSPVQVELYRTVDGATDATFYLVNTATIKFSNSGTATPSADYFHTEVAATTSGTLTAQPRLYTSADSYGLQYDSTPPPSFLWQCTNQGRHFGVACVEGLFRLYYSSAGQGLNAIGVPVEWNFNNYALCPPELGEIRSIAPLDDKILVFGTRGVGVTQGDGPVGYNQAGVNANNVPAPNTGFSPVTPIPVPAGVLASGSPVTTPDGVIYQDVQGFCQITRGLEIHRVGEPVDPMAGLQVGSAATLYGRGQLVPTLQAVVWANPAGAPLVMDLAQKKWSTWPALGGLQSLAVRADGTTFAVIQPMSSVAASAQFGVLDTDRIPAAADLVLETPWIQLGTGVSGEGALWEMMLSLNYLAPHSVKVEQAYNYGAYNAPTTQAFTSAPIPFHLRYRPISTSRVWSVRYRITITPPNTTYGYNCCTISDMLIFAGTKQGLNKVGSGASK